MSDKLVEAVARALAEYAGIPWKNLLPEARTAILETLRQIREPTGPMIAAGNVSGFKATWRTVTTDVWQAIVDHLIAEIGDD